MKILHILPNFAAGGAERVVLYYLIDWMQIHEDEMSALALYSDKGTIFDEEIKKLSLNVEYANCKPNNILDIIGAIRKKVRDYKPDVIHSHMRLLPYVALATTGLKVRIVHTFHTEPEVSSAGKILFFDRFCLKHCNVIPVCLNEEMAERANKLYRINFSRFLYNGIRLEDYCSLDIIEKEKLKASLGVTDKYVIGHVGRYVKIKNHDLIVRVFNEYLKINPNAMLLLVGDGPEYENIKKMVAKLGIESSVKMLGVRSDVPKLLQIMDCFIFPSIVEGLGISVIEAQAAGVPCIISNIIPAEAVATDMVTRINLQAPLSTWVAAIQGKIDKEIPCHQIDDFDIKCINKKLKEIYEDAVK